VIFNSLPLFSVYFTNGAFHYYFTSKLVTSKFECYNILSSSLCFKSCRCLGPILYCNSSFQEYAKFCILRTIKELHDSDKIVRVEMSCGNPNQCILGFD
jgi:hypothetical protein